MDIEDRLKQLQSSYSYALSGAVCAKARYLALLADGSCTAASIAHARTAWDELETRKITIIARMVVLEELEDDAIA